MFGVLPLDKFCVFGHLWVFSLFLGLFDYIDYFGLISIFGLINCVDFLLVFLPMRIFLIKIGLKWSLYLIMIEPKFWIYYLSDFFYGFNFVHFFMWFNFVSIHENFLRFKNIYMGLNFILCD